MNPWEFGGRLFPAPPEMGYNAKEVDCQVCGAKAGERCFSAEAILGPNHIERARKARWIKMSWLIHNLTASQSTKSE